VSEGVETAVNAVVGRDGTILITQRNYRTISTAVQEWFSF